MRTSRCLPIVAALAFVCGCGGDGVLPTSPATPTAGPIVPAPILPIHGEITVVAMEPQSGATVRVFDCDPSIPPNFSVAQARPKHFTGPCAGVRAVVHVELAEELLDARVLVEFRDGTGNRCAYMDSYSTSIPARTQTTIAFGELMLTENAPDAPLTFCALPVTTTEAVVSVFSGGGISAQPSLSRHIPHTYTFVGP